MCDLDVMGATSKLSVIRKAAALARVVVARARPTAEVERALQLKMSKTASK